MKKIILCSILIITLTSFKTVGSASAGSQSALGDQSDRSRWGNWRDEGGHCAVLQHARWKATASLRRAGVAQTRLRRGSTHRRVHRHGPAHCGQGPAWTHRARLWEWPHPQSGRRTQAGGKKTPEIISRIEELLKHDTAGDPMSAIKWTRRTTSNISVQLATLGIAVSKNTVGRLLKQMDFLK